MYPIYGCEMVCGAVFMNTGKYPEAGMDNEEFYGWGNEDYERQFRFNELNYKTYRSDGVLYHFSHPRDQNGKFRSLNQVRWTRSQLNKIITSSKGDLLI